MDLNKVIFALAIINIVVIVVSVKAQNILADKIEKLERGGNEDGEYNRDRDIEQE